MTTIIPDDQGRTELNPARFDALRNLCIAARWAAQVKSSTLPPSAESQPTLAELEQAEYVKAYEQTGTVRGAAALLGVSPATASNKFQSWRIRPHRIATNIIRLAACVLAVALVGCAGGNVEGRKLNDEARMTRAQLPPLPSATRRANNSVASSLAVAPPAPEKPWYFCWTGPTNGWVHVVGRKETLISPWQEFARVTNRTECPVTPGFYTVLRMEDTDLPGHVWVGR